ncbi:HDOD domain-containing protein [Desulfovibrio inopinatus]|uniref:HDOD domain-containing protein n=1 Tax=Desulfovibrio inopinatus TaxID=102109 RepID=UPI00040C2651|nr:HDOD domain-containing protein [Desulfovibrio inopinatus]
MNHERGQQFLLELPSLKHDLPYSSAMLSTLFVQTDSGSTASLHDVAETINQDQGLTIKVLRLANSAFYGLQSEVNTVLRAVSILGLNEIRTLVLALGVSSLARKAIFPDGFDLKQYWTHQLSVAVIASELATRQPDLDADNLFTSGVLHDVGKIITALHRSDDFAAIYHMVHDEAMSYPDAEDQYWGLEHGVIGSMVLKSWYLPEELTEPVNWHHSPIHAPSFKKQALTLCTADALAHLLDDPEYPHNCPWQRVVSKFGLKEVEAVETMSAVLESRNIEQLAQALM